MGGNGGGMMRPMSGPMGGGFPPQGQPTMMGMLGGGGGGMNSMLQGMPGGGMNSMSPQMHNQPTMVRPAVFSLCCS